MTKHQIAGNFIKAGIIFSFIATALYPLYYYLDLSLKLKLIVALLFAISIAVSSAGIYYFLSLHKKNPLLMTGLRLCILAAAFFGLAASVEVSVKWPLEGILVQGDQSFTYALVNRVFIGLEFIWKMMFGLGILLLAIPAIGHPKMGFILPVLGIIIGFFILIVNFQAFPETPETAEITGMGPAISLWHFLIALVMLLSSSWIRENSKEN